MSSSKGRAAVGALLVTMFLLVFGGVQPAAACHQIPQPATYKNISVQVADHMIERDHHGRILILDVRYQCEYNLGHLYGAVLMPYDQLQANISKLEAYKNQAIIVYCKAGARSQIASEILANNSFTRVYNMQGGIIAWINAGYQIYTTYHYATVDTLHRRIQIEIEPLLLHQTGSLPCAGSQTCPSNNQPTDNITSGVQLTVLEQAENRTVVLVTFEFNGTTLEYTVTSTLLWSYIEREDAANRTASFTSIEITAEETSMEFYSLSYMVQNAEYNLALYTNLVPLNSETYNSSFTIMNYAPAGKSEITSLEFVEFNSSVTLSQKYAVLGKVAKEIGKVYEKSGDETLMQLAEGYYTIEEEAKGLSKLVNKQLQEYNREILQSSALILDDWCTVACSTACGMIGSAVCIAGCGALCGGNPFCIVFCAIICGGAWGTACGFLCPIMCGQNPCAAGVGCGGVCGAACSYAASRVSPPWGWVFSVIGCPIACAFICDYVC